MTDSNKSDNNASDDYKLHMLHIINCLIEYILQTLVKQSEYAYTKWHSNSDHAYTM